MRTSRIVGWLLCTLVAAGLIGQSVAAEDWLVRTTGGKTQHILSKDGTITRVEPQRGDPKMDYSKSENRCHSAKQRAKNDECVVEDEYAVDVTGWDICVQGGGNHTDNFFVSFAEGGCSMGYSYYVGIANAHTIVTVYYDLKAGGGPIKAYETLRYQIQNEAETEQLIQEIGFTSYTSSTNSLGGITKLYRNEDGSEAVVSYTDSGDFWMANVVVKDEVSLDKIKVADYYNLPLSTCSTIQCSGFDENGNLQYTATISYDGVLLGRD